MARRIGALPAVLLFFGALTFSATELRGLNRNFQGFRCAPLTTLTILKVAKMQAALPPEELEDFARKGHDGGHGQDSSSGGFRKTPVGQLLFLDAALLAAAFFINLKCARKLHGVLIPEAFWGRLFIWV